jgi:hypothetical protein
VQGDVAGLAELGLAHAQHSALQIHVVALRIPGTVYSIQSP